MARARRTRVRPSRRNSRRRAERGTWSCTQAPTCRARTRRTSSAAISPRGNLRVTSEARPPDVILELPAASNAADVAIDELEMIYAFIYARVGNRADAEDLTQQVALKAIPRLRQGAPPSAKIGRASCRERV